MTIARKDYSVAFRYQWGKYGRCRIGFPGTGHSQLQFIAGQNTIGRSTCDNSTRPTGIRAGRCPRPPPLTPRRAPQTHRVSQTSKGAALWRLTANA
jgi:hypothetical protein